jgi:polysaccharide export outer membrane protein
MKVDEKIVSWRVWSIMLQSAFLMFFLLQVGFAQTSGSAPIRGEEAPAATPANSVPQNNLPDSTNQDSHRLSIGPGDELDVSVYGAPDLTQHVRVGTSGNIYLPLIGTVHVAGLASDEAEALVEQKLADGSFVTKPHVTIYVKEYTTEAVSITGEVNKPGAYPALETRRLYDAFMEAGGLTQTAGRSVTIAHDGQTRPDVVLLSSDPVKSAQANVPIQPGDAISVSKAPIVYVIGEVTKPGGYVLGDAQDGDVASPQLTVIRVIALASGPIRGAALNKSKIIRRTANGIQELPIPLKKIMAGKSPDLPLQAEDILYIPGGRSTLPAGTILGLLASAAIYRL